MAVQHARILMRKCKDQLKAAVPYFLDGKAHVVCVFPASV